MSSGKLEEKKSPSKIILPKIPKDLSVETLAPPRPEQSSVHDGKLKSPRSLSPRQPSSSSLAPIKSPRSPRSPQIPISKQPSRPSASSSTSSSTQSVRAVRRPRDLKKISSSSKGGASSSNKRKDRSTSTKKTKPKKKGISPSILVSSPAVDEVDKDIPEDAHHRNKVYLRLQRLQEERVVTEIPRPIAWDLISDCYPIVRTVCELYDKHRGPRDMTTLQAVHKLRTLAEVLGRKCEF